MKAAIKEITRSRAIVTRSGRRLRGYLKRLPWESPLERDALFVLHAERSFKVVKTQPYEVIYFDGRTTRKHYPDILAEKAGRQLVIEVKRDRDALDPELFRRTEIMTRIFANEGQTYLLFFEKHIRKEPRLSNAKDLFHFEAGRVDEELALASIHRVDQYPGITAQELSAYLDEENLSVVFTLIAQRRIAFDRDRRLSKNSLLFPASTEVSA